MWNQKMDTLTPNINAYSAVVENIPLIYAEDITAMKSFIIKL